MWQEYEEVTGTFIAELAPENGGVKVSAMGLGKSISVYEMMKTIGRAGLATESGTAEEITAYIRKLGPEELVEEFHRAVATLLSRNLLSPMEKLEIQENARDWMDNQPLSP